MDFAFGHGHDLAIGADGEDVETACHCRVILAMVSTTYYF